MRNRVIVAASVAWLLAALAPAVAAPAAHDTTSMLTLPGFAVVEGSSASLVATENGATITVNTSGLVEGNVYTLWAFTFSFPENCVSGCGFDDAEYRAVETGFAMNHVSGHVTGQSGNVNFGGNIAVVNAQAAEYHVVIAEHGALDSEKMPEQIQTPHPGVQIGFLDG